jgi:hypothetical protein
MVWNEIAYELRTKISDQYLINIVSEPIGLRRTTTGYNK